MRFLYICFPIYIWVCLLLTSFSGSVLFEELSKGDKYVLAPLLCPVLRHSKMCARYVSEVS